MSLDPTQKNPKPTVEPAISPAPARASSGEKLKIPDFLMNWGAEMTAPKELVEGQVKPINGTWSGLLHDLVRGIIVEKMPEKNELFIANISGTIQQVLQAMGTIQADAGAPPVKLEDDQFMQNLTSNLLKIFVKYNFTKYKFKSGTNEFEKYDELVGEIKQLFDDLLKCAGLDEKHIKTKSQFVQHLFYPSVWSFDGFAMSGALLIARATVDLPELSRAGFEKLFVRKVIEMLIAQKNLSAKSEDPILTQNKGSSILVDKLVGKIVESLRDGKLAFEYSYLNVKENKSFLNSLINKVLAKPVQEQLRDKEIKQDSANKVLDKAAQKQDLKQPAKTESEQAWETIEGQLKMAMKAILAVVLTPKDKDGRVFDSYSKARIAEQAAEAAKKAAEDAGQDLEALKQAGEAVRHADEQTRIAAEYRNALFIKILDRFEKHKKTLLKDVDTIDAKDEQILLESLSVIVGSEKDRAKMTSLQREASDLLKRKGISWEDEAIKFVGEAWRNPTSKNPLNVLTTWEQEAAHNPKWTAEHTKRVQVLLKRHSLSWEHEAKQFLKKIEYTSAARHVLSQELKPENFAAFIPKFFKAEDLFDEIYDSIGEMALEVHDQQKYLQLEGAKSLETIKDKNLINFVNDMMEGLVATVEDLAEKKEIELKHGEFLNEIVGHLLINEKLSLSQLASPSESSSEESDINLNASRGKVFAKQEVMALAKNILTIVLQTVIKSNPMKNADKAPAENPAEAQAQAFTRLFESFLEDALTGLAVISKSCKALKGKTVQELTAAVGELSKELKLDVKLKTTAEDLLKQYRELLVKQLSRKLLKALMPQELFNSLLPPVLRKSGLWEMVTDEMLAPYIEGISITKDAFEALEENPEHSNQLKLADETKNLLPLVGTITENVIEIVSEIKFTKLLKQEGDSKLKKVDFKILDGMLGNVVKKGGQLTNLIGTLLPPIVQSVLAYHLNPRADGKTSQQRAVEFFWYILEATQACYGKIDAIKAENLDLETLKEAFKDSEELGVEKRKETIKAYCEEMKMEGVSEEILNDREFYVWLKINREMTAGMKLLLDKVLPEDLWNLYVPKQFEKILSRENVGAILIDTLKEGYAHATKMREIVSQGKQSLIEEEGKAAGPKPAPKVKKAPSLQEFIEQKVVEALIDGAKIEPADDESVVWQKQVLQLLLEKEGANGSKPLTKMATDAAFAVFSKLLSGGLSSLNKSTFISNIKKDDPTLIGKVSKMVTLIRTNYKNLNELKVGQKCAEWSQITPDNVKAFLSIGKERLKDEDEGFNAISENFEIKDGVTGFKVYIKNKVTKETREVFIEMTAFVYWEAAFNGINEFIPDEDWKQLVPKMMHSVMTKEMIASLAVPYIYAARQIQEPLQKMAESGKDLVDAVAEDDKEVDLHKFIKEKVFDKIDSVLKDMADSPDKLDDDLPDALDSLFKDILKTKSNLDFVDIKDVLIKRVVYLLTNELFKPAVKDAEGKEVASATSETVASIIPKLSALMTAYETGQNAAAIAQQLMDKVLPQSVWDKIFTGKFKGLIKRKMIVDQIEKKIEEVCGSVVIINEKSEQAMREIKRLDRHAGLLVGRGGGLEEMYNTICKSIDETINEYAIKEKKIAEEQPLLVNELAKGAFGDPVLSNAIKKSAHAIIAVCLAKVFEAKPKQEPEERLLEVMAALMKGYNPADPKASAKAWVKEFLPENLLGEIVPPFLKETLTQEFFADFVAGYVLEVKVTADKLNALPEVKKGDDTSKMQGFVKATLSKYKDSSFSLDGLTGFGGFVKKLEMILTGAIAGDQKGKTFEPVGNLLESFLNGSVASIMSGPQVKKLLDKQFLSEAMVSAMPFFGEVDIAKELPDYPRLSENQLRDLSKEGLKKIGIELKRFEGEKDDAYKQRVINKHFELSCGKLAGKIVLPNGETDLSVPKVAQSAVFNQVEGAIGNQIGRIVNRNERILFAIDFFGVKGADKKEFQAMEDLLKATGSLGNKENAAERMFKDGLVSFAMQKIEQKVCAGLPSFIRWFAVGFVKIIAKIALRVAINRQVWNFVSNAENDPKFRGFVWKLLSFAKSYNPQAKDKEAEEKLSKDVTRAFGEGFRNMGLLKGIRSKAASGVAGVLAGQNFVDLIV